MYQVKREALKSNVVTLLELSLDKRTDPLAKNFILSSAKKGKMFKSVASLLIWHPVLYKVYVILKVLKSENINISSAVEIIDKTRQAMAEMRADKGFQQDLVDARDLCNSIESEAESQ
ncbi:hypothetical protein AVEN_4565-1 [Araneus ventricosus]|uniref:Uncharacterized protein n=1 Tax=Araneus ventricosus TaxID=182803 RepID=A0A4Y2BMD4_ARAVE|nr:hypothetical protein AVEN_4565-1 [Araneus ventricosus]